MNLQQENSRAGGSQAEALNENRHRTRQAVALKEKPLGHFGYSKGMRLASRSGTANSK